MLPFFNQTLVRSRIYWVTVLCVGLASAQTAQPEPRISLSYQWFPVSGLSQSGDSGVGTSSNPGKAKSKKDENLSHQEAKGKSFPKPTSPPVLVLTASIDLPPGWHINSDAPPDSFLVPTRVSAFAQGLNFGKPIFPAPVPQYSQALGMEVPLYSGVFQVTVPFKRSSPSAQSTAGGYPKTSVTLHYQACNDAMCLPPKDVTAELPPGAWPKGG